jgi:hypothetical protein
MTTSTLLLGCLTKAEDTTGDLSENTSDEPQNGDISDTAAEEEFDTAEEENDTDETEQTDPPEEQVPDIDVCALAEQDPTTYTLPTLAEEAAQFVLLPGEGETYTLNKASNEEGWFVLEVPSWMCDVHFYTEEDVVIELLESPDWELGSVAELIGECDSIGFYHYSWTFHAWGSYTVNILAPETTEIWLATVMTTE